MCQPNRGKFSLIDRLASTLRLATLALVVGTLVAPPAAEAQETKIYRVGYLGQGSRPSGPPPTGSITMSLQDLGYVEGRNIVIDRRYADGDAERFPRLAAELVALKSDLIIAETTPGPLAAKRATATIPIVFFNVTDPVSTGLVASLVHPGGNVTGIADFGIEMVTKGLELIHAAVPKATRIAVLMSDNSVHPFQLREIQAAAKTMSLTVLPTMAASLEDFEAAFGSMERENAGAVIVLGGPPIGTLARLKRIAELASKANLPMICADRQCVELGGLLSYSPTVPERWRSVAFYVDRILKGARPGDLPVMQPRDFDLAVNLKTARTLGLTIPQSLLLSASKIVE